MQPQDGVDCQGIDIRAGTGEPLGDPGRLGPPLELGDVLLAPPSVGRHDGDEAATGHEPDDEQPPLEFRHLAGRIGRGAPASPAYTRPR
jgi:hypothetical protein